MERMRARARTVRELRPADLDAVVNLDAVLTGERQERYWRHVLARFLERRDGIALGVDGPAGLDGYLCGEVRAFEFGSRPCGWIFSLGVRPSSARSGVASALVEEAARRFRALGVGAVRTMVARTDVPVLALFRGHGFVGGPFVQLELELGASTAEVPA